MYHGLHHRNSRQLVFHSSHMANPAVLHLHGCLISMLPRITLTEVRRAKYSCRGRTLINIVPHNQEYTAHITGQLLPSYICITALCRHIHSCSRRYPVVSVSPMATSELWLMHLRKGWNWRTVNELSCSLILRGIHNFSYSYS